MVEGLIVKFVKEPIANNFAKLNIVKITKRFTEKNIARPIEVKLLKTAFVVAINISLIKQIIANIVLEM